MNNLKQMTNDETLVAISDKLNLIYLTAHNFKPIKSERLKSQVYVYYENTDAFKKAQMDFVVEEDLTKYRNAQYKVEQILRTTK